MKADCIIVAGSSRLLDPVLVKTLTPGIACTLTPEDVSKS
jgi:hypothetical protein